MGLVRVKPFLQKKEGGGGERAQLRSKRLQPTKGLEVQVHHLISLGGWNDVIFIFSSPAYDRITPLPHTRIELSETIWNRYKDGSVGEKTAPRALIIQG
jgi:hypothetical protein